MDEAWVQRALSLQVMAMRSHRARISGTRHVKHAAHVAAAAVGRAVSPRSGDWVPPSAASPYLRPVLGLMSASTALLMALEMMGRLENVVKISAPEGDKQHGQQ